MPILVSCDQCGRDYKMKSKLAGTRFRCRTCDHVLRVPHPEKEASDEEVSDGTKNLDDLSWGPVPPVGGVLGLPPAMKSESTSTRVAPRERKRKWRNRRSVKLPWRKLVFGLMALILIALLILFGLDHWAR